MVYKYKRISILLSIILFFIMGAVIFKENIPIIFGMSITMVYTSEAVFEILMLYKESRKGQGGQDY